MVEEAKSAPALSVPSLLVDEPVASVVVFVFESDAPAGLAEAPGSLAGEGAVGLAAAFVSASFGVAWARAEIVGAQTSCAASKPRQSRLATDAKLRPTDEPW